MRFLGVGFGVTFVGEMSTTSSEGVTPLSSLVRAHVPLPLGSPLLQHLTSRSRSLCRLLLAPAAIRIFSTLFCESFLACLVPYPGGPIGCICLLPSPMSSAFPLGGWVGFPLLSTMQLLVGTISRLQTFRYVQASEFAHLPDRSYRCNTAGQLRLLLPGKTCFVTSARTGYAIRPNTGN